MVRLVLALLLGSAVACVKPRAFSCSDNAECGAGGQCEPVGFCSFADTACAGGRRYGDLAGSGLGGVCVGEEPDAGQLPDGSAIIDAGLGDGGVFLGCFSELEAGWYHQCLRKGGQVECWGYNGDGQLGTGDRRPRSTPVAVAGISDAVELTLGGYHTCARRTGDRVWCWGGSAYRQVDDTTEYLAPHEVPVPPLTAISAGYLHTCGIDANQEVWCWGDDSEGQLGQGAAGSPSGPVKVPGVATAVQISAGQTHTCARLGNGTVKCWGKNSEGQLGTGTAGAISGPTLAALTDVVDVATGARHTCVRTVDRALWCWGSNETDQLGGGSGAPAFRATPTQIGGLSEIVEIETGPGHTCARRSDGTVWCVGLDDQGQLGQGSTTYARDTFRKVEQLPAVDALAAGHHHTCARGGDGIYCWGDGGYGVLADGALVQSLTPTPSAITSGAAEVITGFSHTCARMTAGAIRCWGYGGYGQLGNEDDADHSTPVDVATLTMADELSAGRDFTCARKGGNAFCWGANGDGFLGDGTRMSRLAPVAVNGITTAAELSSGIYSSCVRKTDGAVSCWGENGLGQLGNGMTTDALEPVGSFITTGSSAVASGETHTCAVVAGGEVRCWGSNGSGQLGDGTTTTPAPQAMVTVKVVGGAALTNIVELTAGYDFVCGRSATAIFCWGDGYSGQLGNDVLSPSAFAVEAKEKPGASPVSVAASKLSAFGHTVCALKAADGTVLCWGAGSSGQLGSGATADLARPTTIAGLTGATSVSVGGTHACAVNGAGAVVCWGLNDLGQLGTGVRLEATRPSVSLATCP